MREFSVKLLSYEDLTDEEKENQPNNGCDKEDATYLAIMLGDERIFVESDAMEREDARFDRDMNWIVGALYLAYEAGQVSKESVGVS